MRATDDMVHGFRAIEILLGDVRNDLVVLSVRSRDHLDVRIQIAKRDNALRFLHMLLDFATARSRVDRDSLDIKLVAVE